MTFPLYAVLYYQSSCQLFVASSTKSKSSFMSGRCSGVSGSVAPLIASSVGTRLTPPTYVRVVVV